MKLYTKIYLTALLVMLLLQQNSLMAQGCSDAGFCTLGSIKAVPGDVKLQTISNHRLTIQNGFGMGDEDVFIMTPALQYDYRSAKGLGLQVKITGNYADGNLGSAFGFGDMYLAGTKSWDLKNDWHFSPTIGFKIPLNKADLKQDGLPLPMQYQSSLGTFDAIAGVSFTKKGWQLTTALQLPLSGRNENGFLPVFWPGKPEAAAYPSTFKLQRKPDALLRIAHNWNPSDKFQINAGLLGILHTGNDSYLNPILNNRSMDIEGSQGFTLNVTGALYWQIGKRTRLGLNGGFPLVVRDVRPDGLTRQWVVVPECSFQF